MDLHMGIIMAEGNEFLTAMTPEPPELLEPPPDPELLGALPLLILAPSKGHAVVIKRPGNIAQKFTLSPAASVTLLVPLAPMVSAELYVTKE
jgi:hypothetical protein